MSTGDTEAAARELIAGFSGDAAFLARNLATGEEIGYRPDALMPTASTIKTLVLAELYRQVDAGTIDLDTPVTMLPDDLGGGSGILKDLSPSVVLSVHDHAVLMIALSDNTSTAVLVRLLGRERILASAAAWGMPSTTAGFGATRGTDPKEYAASTPRDLCRLQELIATDAIISPAACAGIRDILITQQYHDQIGRYLPYDQYRRNGVTHPGPIVVRSKSGFMYGVRVDAGIVETPATRYVICLMNAGSSDHSWGPEQEGAVLNGRISRIVFDAWT
jgi:beta-lactamase class A